MLTDLSIRDVVLINHLDINFLSGLSVLTGETGAGKTILLDSLGLALGARSEKGLIRRGANQLSVTAKFSIPLDHPVLQILNEINLESSTNLVMHRIISTDGRSRAFVNDHPISINLMRRLGDNLVEIHDQLKSHGLLDPSTHRPTLDAFANIDITSVHQSWTAWQNSIKMCIDFEAILIKAQEEENFIRYTIEELTNLDLKLGEEEILTKQRTIMMNGEKLFDGMNIAQQSLCYNCDVAKNIRNAQHALELVTKYADNILDPVISALDRASIEVEEAQNLLEKISSSIKLDSKILEKIEERLFLLRAIARKHNVTVDDLISLNDRFSNRLKLITNNTDEFSRLKIAEQQAKLCYYNHAKELSLLRKRAAKRLDTAVAKELKPLKLDKATFRTKIDLLNETAWNETGIDRVIFEVATNLETTYGSLAKIASGGELSRFILALKVVLALKTSVQTIVFDEIDNGIGGAVATAVGERLSKLAIGFHQVLVVTHSPQVAAKGTNHLYVKKVTEEDTILTRVFALNKEERQEEIARMLAGAKITDQARAAATSLLTSTSD
ncbi:MAG: DNA repair protein RecN [Rhodospirillaceae bacterium]|jgi:DNA repair protein RecN (Recombination protein N)|nr:DNA repair protein RecN [Rhodospirillaceae bacterium]